MFKRGRRRAFAALAAAAMVLTGCGGSGDDADPNTLRLWHYEAPNSAMGVAWNEAVKQFEAAHPGVRVQVEEKGFEQIQKTAAMVLNSADAPDVMEYNKGNATTGLLARQGVLTDMSDEVARRGWDKKLAPGLQTTARYDEHGVMGTGKWYGIPNYAEYEMVYYNKDMFAEHGVAVPTTLDEFTAALDTFASAGITPLAVGGAEYPAQQILYQLALSKADRNWVDRYQRYTGQVDFHDAAWTHAATTFADWVRKGYISKSAASVKAEDMGLSFTSGKYPMMVSGSWWYGRFTDEIKGFQWDTFLWPGNALNAGSGGNHWVVPRSSKKKQLAYDFIDTTLQQGVQRRLGEAGGVPVSVDASQVTDPKARQLIDTFTTITSADGLAFYPDWPAPGFYEVLVSGTQKLINGTASPSEVLDEFAKPYQENRANNGN